MRILVVQGAFEDMYEPAWCRALQEIGVETTLFPSHDYTLPGLLGRVERRLLAGPGVTTLRKILVRQVHSLRPAVTLLYQGHYFDFDTVRELKQATFVVGYHNDDPFGVKRGILRYRHLHPALPAYDGFHAFRAVNVSDLRAAGVPNVQLLLPYFRPWIDYPRTPSRDDLGKWSCDICFAGHLEPDERIHHLTEIARNGLDLRLHTQPDHAKRLLPSDVWKLLGPTHVVLGDDYRNALCGSRIGLSFYSRWNRDHYTTRSFEIPACGVFLLSERTEAMCALFDEGIEAEYFSTTAELIDKARYYLKHDSERRAIAQRGYDKVMRGGHDIHSRMKQWLADTTKWRS
ncbi:MAG: glycosyltransferase [Bryobacteraceae bacterium]